MSSSGSMKPVKICDGIYYGTTDKDNKYSHHYLMASLEDAVISKDNAYWEVMINKAQCKKLKSVFRKMEVEGARADCPEWLDIYAEDGMMFICFHRDDVTINFDDMPFPLVRNSYCFGGPAVSYVLKMIDKLMPEME